MDGEHVRLVYKRHPPAPVRAAPLRAPARTRNRTAARRSRRLIRIVSNDRLVAFAPGQSSAPQTDPRSIRAPGRSRCLSGARIGQRNRRAGKHADRPHARVEVEALAELDLRRDLRAVRIAHVGQPHRAEQDRVARTPLPRSASSVKRNARRPGTARRRPRCESNAQAEPAGSRGERYPAATGMAP